MFRDDAVIFLSENTKFGAIEEIEWEINTEGPGNWIFSYTTKGDYRVACVGRNENGKPEIKWDNPA